ncbi:hypothetical protein CHLRE_14g633550v5 [Chlamydomonas reinhardtii]|uniref:SCP2 domain-containing protein n=1 Tax=Chlamydomonas reinhardtii TaxID=3055 RepID=A8IUL9_CHLRE|nr:uncharacterized protein CHLRE_14g633550v5 [Chlamydomonas reinhardtii]PNW73483.1 hypothetical protein CHLRE_14g633550v5 [Chlamydomonas reinhardtii]|eukprot:XP_001692640.1 predicted protein [Chlamydomonas reinhardtii]
MQQVLIRMPTAGGAKASGPLLQQLAKSLETEGAQLASKIKGIVVFKIDDAEWSLDLSEGSSGALYEGPPAEGAKPDLTLTTSDATFAQMVMGKVNPQTAFLTRKLKINGSMGMAMKLAPVLEAAQPRAKM